MNDFDLSTQEGRVMAGDTNIPLLIVGEQRDLWFRGNNLTAFLEYAQPRIALTKILKTRNTKIFAELLPEVVSSEETTPVDDPRARYVNEPGLYKVYNGKGRVLSGLGVRKGVAEHQKDRVLLSASSCCKG